MGKQIQSTSTLALLFALTATLAGCGGGSGVNKETDTSGIQITVTNVGGAARDGSVERFEKLFAPGAAPKDLKGYAVDSIFIPQDEVPSVSDDTATFKVHVEKNGQEQETTWTAVRIGDEWKITEAPLP